MAGERIDTQPIDAEVGSSFDVLALVVGSAAVDSGAVLLTSEAVDSIAWYVHRDTQPATFGTPTRENIALSGNVASPAPINNGTFDPAVAVHPAKQNERWNNSTLGYNMTFEFPADTFSLDDLPLDTYPNPGFFRATIVITPAVGFGDPVIISRDITLRHAPVTT